MSQPANPIRSPKRHRLVWIAVLAGLVTVAGAATWRTGDMPLPFGAVRAVPEDSPPISAIRGVRAMTVRPAPVIEEKRFTGVVVARYEAPLAFRVPGRIDARLVELGEHVTAGQTLLMLDGSDFLAATRVAEANLASAEAQAVQAAADEARQRQILADGWIGQGRYDLALAAATSAERAVDAAREALALARNQQGYAVLAAPYDGIVTAIDVEAGQVVTAGQSSLTFARSGAREAEVVVPEGQIADLSGWTAVVTFWGRDGAHGAALREVAPQADPVGRTHAARYVLPGELTVDLGATATVVLSRRRDPAVTLPASAVFFRDGQAMAWVVAPEGNRAMAHPVTVVSLGSETARVDGLADGAQVITLGVHRIDETLPIRVIEDTSVSEAER